MCPAARALGPHRLQQGQGLQRGWGELQWDQPPGRSTQQESQGAAGCQQLEQMSRKTALSHPVPSCPVLFRICLVFFFPFFGKAAPDKFRLVMQTPAEPPQVPGGDLGKAPGGHRQLCPTITRCALGIILPCTGVQVLRQPSWPSSISVCLLILCTRQLCHSSLLYIILAPQKKS